jgi:Domain of unknown function (DUF4166)
VDGTGLVFLWSKSGVRRLGRREMRLPDLLSPGTAHILHGDLGNGRFRFAMTIRHRFFGMLFYQDGIFREEEGQ